MKIFLEKFAHGTMVWKLTNNILHLIEKSCDTLYFLLEILVQIGHYDYNIRKHVMF